MDTHAEKTVCVCGIYRSGELVKICDEGMTPNHAVQLASSFNVGDDLVMMTFISKSSAQLPRYLNPK